MEFGYYAICDKRLYPGVYAKIQGVVNASKIMGCESYLWAFSGAGLLPYIKLALSIAAAKEAVIFVRGVPYMYWLITPAVLIARFRNKRVYLDVPTPHGVAMLEILSSKQSLFVRGIKCIAVIISGPFAFWPATRVIQYAPEGSYFGWGNNNRITIIGNGIDMENVPPRHGEPTWPSGQMILVGVAMVEDWHGYDRIIRAIAYHRYVLREDCDIVFRIIGEGPAVLSLKALSDELGISDRIVFLGILNGDALQSEYKSAHIAIDSLALHRIGLSVASTLKSREYCAVGMPFVTAYFDYDFPTDTEFRYAVSQTDSYEDIALLLVSLRKSKFPRVEEIRYFAKERLSWVSKLKSMGICDTGHG